ncbi:uncharacterized protein TRIADDRAFT_61413 [Trichoplax adhaerens]|uniref:CARD domain-containing protein n=1 Tax=Trichoplax adhaerens TaxID=10228 RepID=B3SAX4_TRIAD|nr:predicted protein [Trichoplax adhaerens]EDV20066.1 predicted protein [Trichoplax adhaerens]|eukprot:XP_002117450.1 predicted protein [Trichoplax adhaerens]
MGLSWHINDVIRQYKHDILVNITSLDIFITLHNRSILSDQELRKIKNQGPKSFISILRRKNDLEFYGFCEVLEGSLMQSIKELGTTLRQEAKQNEPANEESKIVAASSTFSGLIGSTASKIGQLASGRKSKAKKKKNTPQGIERKSKNSLPHQEIASSKGNKTDESFYSRKKAPAKDMLVDNKSVKDGKFHQESPSSKILTSKSEPGVKEARLKLFYGDGRGSSEGNQIDDESIHEEEFYQDLENVDPRISATDDTEDEEDTVDSENSSYDIYKGVVSTNNAATSDTKLPSEKASETFNEQKQNRIYIYALQSRDCLQNFAAVTSYLRSKEILTPSQQSAIFAKPNDHELAF